MYYGFDSVAFAERIKKLRKDHGKTQQELADIVGCDLRTVQSWESKKNEVLPKLDYLLPLCAEFMIDLNSLIFNYNAYPPSPERISHETGISISNINKLEEKNYNRDRYDNAEYLDTVNLILSSEAMIRQIMWYRKACASGIEISEGATVIYTADTSDRIRVNKYNSEIYKQGIKDFHVKEFVKAMEKAIEAENQ